ncbi:MAG TPA: DNRLRE domain-containing protein [Planctomycetota bacterium]|nr:DNRLRE domain-containing protein [Planctomycetota bacterium]
MTPDRLSDLASRLWEAGSLTPEEERELGVALRDSAEARRLLHSYFRLEGALLEQARAGLLSAPLPARPAVHGRRPPSGASWGAWAAGLAAAGLLAALFFLSGHDSSSVPANLQARSSPPRPSVPASIPTTPTAPEIPAPAATPPAPASGPSVTPEKPFPSEPTLATPLPPPPAIPGAPNPPLQAPNVPDVAPSRDAVAAEVVIERVEGEVTISEAGARTAGRAGDAVRAGQNLETGSGKSLAVLTFPDGTRIEARPETLLRDIREKGGSGGRTLTLQRGMVWAQVRPQPQDRPFLILSPRGEARVLGTVFTLRADPDPKGLLRLDVQEGKVRFTRSSDSRSVDVGAGHSVSSGQGTDLVLLRSQDVVQSFQDGRFPTADYAGTRDTMIAEKSPQTTYGGARALVAETEDAKEKRKASWALLRWDLGSLPPGSVVHSVSVSLHILEPSRGQALHFYEPARSWSESEASWKYASAGNLWRFPGSLGAADRWPVALGTLAPLQKGEYTAVLGEAGIALVQSWINTPSTNLGLQIAVTSPGGGIHFSSREALSPEARPRLTVIYTPKK